MSVLEQSPVTVGSDIERIRARSRSCAPLFIADWLGALFLHYEVEPSVLQAFVPFQLDLWNGRAFVSLVAFIMRGMRFAKLGRIGAWLCRPMAMHEFLNLRTYVRYGDETGICFLSEWLPNRLSVCLGPILYALPYRHAAIRYSCDGGRLQGKVQACSGCFCYEGNCSEQVFAYCEPDSVDEFLIERYAAFNAGHFSSAISRTSRRVFHVWHEPWPQAGVKVKVIDDGLLWGSVLWWREARFVGANYSPGVLGVRMSAPGSVA